MNRSTQTCIKALRGKHHNGTETHESVVLDVWLHGPAAWHKVLDKKHCGSLPEGSVPVLCGCGASPNFMAENSKVLFSVG